MNNLLTKRTNIRQEYENDEIKPFFIFTYIPGVLAVDVESRMEDTYGFFTDLIISIFFGTTFFYLAFSLAGNPELAYLRWFYEVYGHKNSDSYALRLALPAADNLYLRIGAYKAPS
ncbi:hypothetical protein RhiirA5_413936 [Rhizophagus irregularis]|uniref:Uncharacterized protein n=1 Tax=Rhizophagus irregularis TaxID=588596 RepID=A0A2I1FH78_9GLOM|nr:hypothetical protein RhiirA5_413936 [Rhizophagus irregularis]PKC74835.1 hypothetical protein RhiirA1_449536 [Rhizophagus irregularis]PKY33707.1 hypothetical protein RhiirB3_452835 [Rhizophagus irregularis]CAB4477964.1 unnamed protein product [Rhizophagus irregularis]